MPRADELMNHIGSVGSIDISDVVIGIAEVSGAANSFLGIVGMSDQ